MSGIDRLNGMFGRDWPHPAFTREEHLQDLIEHAQQSEPRTAFAYTVLSPDKSECLGCVYINLPRGYPVDAHVYPCVRQCTYEQGLDPILLRSVKVWLDQCWPFTNIMYPRRREEGSWEALGGRLT